MSRREEVKAAGRSPVVAEVAIEGVGTVVIGIGPLAPVVAAAWCEEWRLLVINDALSEEERADVCSRWIKDLGGAVVA